MLINEFFLRLPRLIAVAGVATVGFVTLDRSASAQSYTAAPTPVYGSTESQATIRYQGPGLPGAEPQQSVTTGSRHALFDVAGYEGVIYAPVTPPYNAAAAYQNYEGQPMRGPDAIMAQSVDGAP